ncbi:glycosyltransferase family 2 protein [Elongatibacter sediminis]|uniref:Glycosyltransferase n=1 Tax=Elongatibacter sediminis TaxID=3119006 RepID=A0AAW9R9P6_9GAMM
MDKPFVSVIIPSYCRPGPLRRCLQRLREQTYPTGRFEVIVVDDGSNPPLDDVAASLRDLLDITLMRQKNSGPAAARNRGAAEARGELLLFTDDDCLPDPGWIEAFAQSHTRTPLALLGGEMVNHCPDNSCAVASQIILDSAYTFYNSDPVNARFFASSNIALPADTYHSVGGFSEAFRTASEDRELCDRWRWRGHPLVSVPAAVVRHTKSPSLREFVHQHFSYGRGAFQFHRERARRGTVHVSREVFRYPVFLWTLLRAAAAQPLRRFVPVASLLCVAQAVNALGFGYAAVRGTGPHH